MQGTLGRSHKEWIGPEIELMQQSVSLSKIRLQLDSKLNEMFKPFLKPGDAVI